MSNPQSELREAIKFALFTPVHVGHENIEPDEIAITSDGKDHYIDKLTEIALNYGREQVSAYHKAVMEKEQTYVWQCEEREEPTTWKAVSIVDLNTIAKQHGLQQHSDEQEVQDE